MVERIEDTCIRIRSEMNEWMMSMSDYKVGSKTEEYRGYVDKAYDLAEKVAEARPREKDRIEALAKRKVEDSVMGVAIEAEMQGFIYGFKVFEILLNRELATA